MQRPRLARGSHRVPRGRRISHGEEAAREGQLSRYLTQMGVSDPYEPFDWHMAAVKGQIQRKNGSVVLLDDTGTEKVRWNFFNGWPSKWDGPSFNAKGNDVAIETLTISCERVERA